MATRRVDRNRAAFIFAIGAVTFFLLVAVLSAAVGEFVADIFRANWPLAFSGTVALILLAFWLMFTQYDRVNRQISASADPIDPDELDSRRFLICGYSLPMKQEDLDALVALDLTSDQVVRDPEEISKSKNREPFQNWQQNIRVMNRLPNLNKVYVVSPDRDHFERFSEIIRYVFADKFKIELIEGRERRDIAHDDGTQPSFRFGHRSGWLDADYEDYNYVTAAIETAFRKVRLEFNLSEVDMQRQVAVDATAGQKIFSTAAAIASLNRELVFTYAKTGKSAADDPGGILVYDANVKLFGELLKL